VKVTNDGNVVPWLMACQALVHNGCTTGIEAYAMGIPTVSYRATVDARYDEGFYRLPNLVSEQCFDLDELKSMLVKLLNGAPAASVDNDRQKLIDWHLAALSGPLACERIVAVLEQLISENTPLAPPGLGHLLRGKFMANARTAVKRFKDSRPGSHNRKEFQRHRYPQLTPQDIENKLKRFRKITGSRHKFSVDPFLEQFFLIEP
jgi:hypothetical protein